MRIAYISYEYPPDTAFGGIATYMYNISRVMRLRGHEVEVFCASEKNNALHQLEEDGRVVHCLLCKDRKTFREAALTIFTERHTAQPFDIVESPEYNADGLRIKEKFPQLPLVVKFHTPSFFVKQLNKAHRKNTFKQQLKRWLGIGRYQKEKDAEYAISLLADGLCAPSQAMKNVVSEAWQILPEKITVMPNLYLPTDALLRLPAESHYNRVTFIGRLEMRKGVDKLAQAIPAVLQQYPGVQFRFVGKSDPAPDGKRLMSEYIQEMLKEDAAQLEFTGSVLPEAIPQYLAETDICVFPSLWEAAGYVCLEAMSAARGIVASYNGGMKDMLEDCRGGILVDPYNVNAIAEGIVFLLQHPGERKAMAGRAREKVQQFYCKELAAMNEAFYHQLIAKDVTA
jgi:glycogen synthase